MPHPPNTPRLLLALAIAAACALPGCQRASETIAEKASEVDDPMELMLIQGGGRSV